MKLVNDPAYIPTSLRKSLTGVISRVEETAALVRRDIGRDPDTLARSTMAGVLVGRSEDEVVERERTLLAAFGNDAETGEAWLEERRLRWVYGTPDQARAQVRRFVEAGIERIMFQDFIPWDLDVVDVIGEEIIGRL